MKVDHEISGWEGASWIRYACLEIACSVRGLALLRGSFDWFLILDFNRVEFVQGK
jgi:hypothetical protein